MASLCERSIKSCISVNCENPIFEGIDSTAYIFNRKDIQKFEYDDDNPNIITEIVMVEDMVQDVSTPRNGYKIEMTGKQPFAGSTTEMTETTISNRFTENVSFFVQDHDAVTAELIDNLANGRYVVVLHNEYKDTFQIFGAKKSLVATGMTRDPYGDNNGAWEVTLTAENTPNSALFVYHEDTSGSTPVEDTKAYLESLVSCE